MSRLYIPYLQFRSNCIIRFYLPALPKSSLYDIERINLSSSNIYSLTGETTYAGVVTEGVRKRIARAVTLLVQSTKERKVYNQVTGKFQKFKLGFWTLTVSSSKKLLTAKEAHSLLLEPFLRICRQKYGLRSYIWKAELQKRGQIHYHITTDCFCHFQKIRDTWNNLQRKAGLLDEYYSKQGHYDANSTDVHSVYKIKNIEAYLVKYLSKVESEKGSTIGKVWDCSKNLKGRQYFVVEECSHESRMLEELEGQEMLKIKSTDFCDIIFFKEGSTMDILSEQGSQRFQEYMYEIAQK